MDMQIIMDFWYNFDLLFNPEFGQVPQEIQNTYTDELQLLQNWLIYRSATNRQNYPTNFIDKIKNDNKMVDSIKILCNYQKKEYNKLLNLNNGEDLFDKAFEYFGQGVLFDNTIDSNTNQPRRPDNERIHMMDSLYFGYPRWHVFCRSAVIAGEDIKFWLNLSRLVALAYELHMQLHPQQSKNGEDPNNQEHPEIVQQLKTKFTNFTFDQLDDEFDNPHVRDLFHM
jgi:hypothetical protein